MTKKLLLLFLYTNFIISQAADRPFVDNNYKTKDNWKSYVILGVCVGCIVIGKLIYKLHQSYNSSNVKPDYNRVSSINQVPSLVPTSDYISLQKISDNISEQTIKDPAPVNYVGQLITPNNKNGRKSPEKIITCPQNTPDVRPDDKLDLMSPLLLDIPIFKVPEKTKKKKNRRRQSEINIDINTPLTDEGSESPDFSKDYIDTDVSSNEI